MPNLQLEIESPEPTSLYIHTIFSLIKRSALSLSDGETAFMDELIHLSDIGMALSLTVSEHEIPAHSDESDELSQNDIESIARHLASVLRNEHLPEPLYNHIYEAICLMINTTVGQDELRRIEQTPEWIGAVIRDYVTREND